MRRIMHATVGAAAAGLLAVALCAPHAQARRAVQPKGSSAQPAPARTAETEEAPIGRVTASFGHASLQRAGETSKPYPIDLYAGIHNHDRIQTDGGGLSVLLASRVVLKIDMNTALRVNETETQTTIVLERGSVHVYVGKRPATSGPVVVQDEGARIEGEQSVFLASYNPQTHSGYYACEHAGIKLQPTSGDGVAIALGPDTQAELVDGKLSSRGSLDREVFARHKQSLDRLAQTTTEQGSQTFRLRIREADSTSVLSQLAAANWIDRTVLSRSRSSGTAGATPSNPTGQEKDKGKDKSSSSSGSGSAAPAPQAPSDSAPGGEQTSGSVDAEDEGPGHGHSDDHRGRDNAGKGGEKTVVTAPPVEAAPPPVDVAIDAGDHGPGKGKGHDGPGAGDLAVGEHGAQAPDAGEAVLGAGTLPPSADPPAPVDVTPPAEVSPPGEVAPPAEVAPPVGVAPPVETPVESPGETVVETPPPPADIGIDPPPPPPPAIETPALEVPQDLGKGKDKGPDAGLDLPGDILAGGKDHGAPKPEKGDVEIEVGHGHGHGSGPGAEIKPETPIDTPPAVDLKVEPKVDVKPEVPVDLKPEPPAIDVKPEIPVDVKVDPTIEVNPEVPIEVKPEVPVEVAPPPVEVAPPPVDVAPPPVDLPPAPVDIQAPPDAAPPPPDVSPPVDPSAGAGGGEVPIPPDPGGVAAIPTPADVAPTIDPGAEVAKDVQTREHGPGKGKHKDKGKD